MIINSCKYGLSLETLIWLVVMVIAGEDIYDH